MMALLIWIFMFVDLLLAVRGDPYYKIEATLRDKLFRHYNRHVLPLTSSKDNVTLDIGLTLLSIDELDVAKEVLKTHIWLQMNWQDVRLTWEPSDYGGRDYISVPIDLLWIPDITVFNNADVFYPSADYLAMVFHDGQVNYSPHITLSTSCSVDLKHFPFDQHTCELKFGSWTYNGDMVSLVRGNFDVSLYQESNTWLLANYSHEVSNLIYACCPETYSFYLAKLVLRRRTGMLMNMYTAPAVCLSLILPSIFLLPTGSTGKIILGTGVLVSHMLMLEMLVEAIPVNNYIVPRLAMYYVANVVLISLSLVLSSIVICLWNKAKRNAIGVPRLVRKIFLDGLGRLLCVRREDYINDNETEDVNKGQMADEQTIPLMAQSEWRQLSVIMDRIFVIIFLVVAIFTIVALFVYPN